ncbi:MAG: ATP-binding cassette domain-containing protein [Spirochaetales bacterium]|nr:ATP-binding cassette domain-containing protein [Spirochaetales bacterium]
MTRISMGWRCNTCNEERPKDEPRYFLASTYASACLQCHGVGSMQVPAPEKLIVRPDLPLCGGAMYSPGFFPKGYLCKPYNGGYYLVQAVAYRYDFDPCVTPWNKMSEEARRAFLFGDSEPLMVQSENRKGVRSTHKQLYPGFYGWIRDWDTGGTYTTTQPCPSCRGARLRQEFLDVTLEGLTIHDLRSMPFVDLFGKMSGIAAPIVPAKNLETILSRLGFLLSVGLGYLNLDQLVSSLSAGEMQRLRLSGLLSGNMSSLTVILDEPCRGLHPTEVNGLIAALKQLRDQENTVVVIEHELDVIRAADYLIELGPGPGLAGGQVVYTGAPSDMPSSTATGKWLCKSGMGMVVDRHPPSDERADVGFSNSDSWFKVTGASENNLKDVDVGFPAGKLIGICGVSGSGKSTLMVDTIGRALAPKKHTTSISYEPVVPGIHKKLLNPPQRCIIVDQTKVGMINPADYLGVEKALRKAYAENGTAAALGLTEKSFNRNCTACGGRGYIKTNLSFLPSLVTPCEICCETGYTGDVLEIRVRGKNIAEMHGLTIGEARGIWNDDQRIVRPLEEAERAGLAYLLLRQPGYSLSGGEAQRLKIAGELAKKAAPGTLYIFDEPTVGLHMEDVERLIESLMRLRNGGHTVVVVEHHVQLLGSCDYLIELGPAGGADGGYIVAEGRPEEVASMRTPTAKFIAEVLDEHG